MKQDQYSKSRGGESKLLLLCCRKCLSPVATYRKDGQGPLLRLYRDRILQPRIGRKLTCTACKRELGVAGIYDIENRKCINLFAGAVIEEEISKEISETFDIPNQERVSGDEFFIRIQDNSGTHFRLYTKETLQAIYDISPTAANFELMILVEGAVFVTIRIYYVVNNEKNSYDDFMKSHPALGKGIEKLIELKIFSDKPEIIVALREYKQVRNEIAHDLYRFKSLDFKKYNSYSDSLRILFEKGLDTLSQLAPLITPDDSTPDWMLRFQKKEAQT